MPLVLPNIISPARSCVIPSNYVADVMADSPIGYWQLNDPDNGNGTTAKDTSGNNRDGIYIHTGSGPSHQQPGPFGIGDCCWTDEELGAGNSYIRFDTTDFDAIIGTASQAYTLEIWQRLPVTPASIASVFDKTDIAGPANWNTMQVLTDGRLNIQIYDGSNNPSFNSTTLVSGTTSWFHLVMVRDVSTPEIILYINGVLEGSSPALASIDTSNTTKLAIGARQAGTDRHMNHAVAHAAVYNTALSPTRIASHYTTGTTNP